MSYLQWTDKLEMVLGRTGPNRLNAVLTQTVRDYGHTRHLTFSVGVTGSFHKVLWEGSDSGPGGTALIRLAEDVDKWLPSDPDVRLAATIGTILIAQKVLSEIQP